MKLLQVKVNISIWIKTVLWNHLGFEHNDKVCLFLIFNNLQYNLIVAMKLKINQQKNKFKWLKLQIKN